MKILQKIIEYFSKATVSKPIMSTNDIRRFLYRTGVGGVGGFVIKRAIGSTWWGCWIVYLMETTSLADKVFWPLLKGGAHVYSAITGKEVIENSEEIVENVVKEITSESLKVITDAMKEEPKTVLAEVIIPAAVAATTVSAEKLVDNAVKVATNVSEVASGVTAQSNTNIPPVLAEGMAKGLVYVSLGTLVLVILGPAGTVGLASGVGATKGTGFLLGYLGVTNLSTLWILPKTIGLVTGICVHRFVKGYVYSENSKLKEVSKDKVEDGEAEGN